MKEIEDNTKKLKDIPYSWIRRINTVQMSRLSKAIHRFNAITIRITKTFFVTEIEQKILKFIWNPKTPNSQSDPEKNKNKARGITPPHPQFQMKLQSYKNQKRMVLAEKHTQRSMEWNEELRDKLTQTQTISQKKMKNMQWRKDSHMQENHTRPLSYTIHKNLLKWIKDLIIRPENTISRRKYGQ